MAARYLKDERPGHTLQPTALVNEVLLKVLDKKATNWENRSHLLGSMAIQMRHILIDYARRRQSHKRIQIELPGDGRQPRFEELLGVHEALERLAAKNPLRADIAVRRVFVGMTIAEIAEELGISEATVKLEWDYTKSWLRFQFRN
jgi:RNA polymerase sigma factor (TIGR02999 family)